MSVRAKFRCHSVLITNHGAIDSKVYKFSPVVDDGTPENKRYHKYTPGGSLELMVDNPDVSFELGQAYYLDFTPAE